MFKVTVSGGYRTTGANGKIIDFDEVVGIMPECDRRMVDSHVQARYLSSWIKADKRYTERFSSRRSCYIDKIEVVPGVPLCNGKDIKRLSWPELVDLAVVKNLLRIPLTNTVDLPAAREVAYLEYSDKVLDRQIDTKAEDYDYANLPSLIVADDAPVAVPEEKQNNEEALKEAEESDSEISLSDLKKMAKKASIKLSPNMTKAQIEKLLFETKKQKG